MPGYNDYREPGTEPTEILNITFLNPTCMDCSRFLDVGLNRFAAMAPCAEGGLRQSDGYREEFHMLKLV